MWRNCQPVEGKDQEESEVAGGRRGRPPQRRRTYHLPKADPTACLGRFLRSREAVNDLSPTASRPEPPRLYAELLHPGTVAGYALPPAFAFHEHVGPTILTYRSKAGRSIRLGSVSPRDLTISGTWQPQSGLNPGKRQDPKSHHVQAGTRSIPFASTFQKGHGRNVGSLCFSI